MIQPRTMLKVADNTGARVIKCIRVLGGRLKKYGRIGDIIIGAVKEADTGRIVKKLEVGKTVIIRQRKSFRRRDGSYIRFDDNAVVIIDANKKPRGGRFFGPMAREIKEKGFDEIAAMATDLI